MKDPYLKPVILGGLVIALLSIVFAPAIFLWAGIGGYAAVRVSNKITKEAISYLDGVLLGLFSGIIGGSCLDVLTIISFRNPDNKLSLIRALEKNWPKEIPLVDFKEVLPSILLTTCIFIVIVAVLFAIIGAYIGTVISKKSKTTVKN